MPDIIRSTAAIENEVTATTASLTIDAQAGDTLVLVVVARSALITPEGFTLLHSGSYGMSSSQTLNFFAKMAEESGTQTIALNQSSSARFYAVCYALMGKLKVEYTGEMNASSTRDIQNNPVTITKPNAKSMFLWAISCTYANTAVSVSNAGFFTILSK